MKSSNIRASEHFWDAKAKENPYWYVSSYGPYNERNISEFWASGPKIWQDLKAAVDYNPRPTDEIVEIGCGVGRLTRSIASEVGHVHALDISENMITLARTLDLRNVSFHCSDGDNLGSLASASADLVLAYCVFQHLPSVKILKSYLREMLRVAKPGGLVAFTLSPRSWYVYLRHILQARQYVKERLSPRGPRGLYRHAWLGIRPNPGVVQACVPIPLVRTVLHCDKWLFYGQLPSDKADQLVFKRDPQ